MYYLRQSGKLYVSRHLYVFIFDKIAQNKLLHYIQLQDTSNGTDFYQISQQLEKQLILGWAERAEIMMLII